MQGCKPFEEKLFYTFSLSDRIPENNFYRRLKSILDLSFIRKYTTCYYGKEGQSSIDPVVFFKLMLIGYMENIASDPKIVEQASMRLDMLYFLNYDIDESLPWHSTLSRTRKLYGEELFLKVFNHILELCVHAGLVDGRIQAVDSAFIKANASMNSLRNVKLAGQKYYKRLNEAEEQEEAEDAQSGDYPPPSCDPRRQSNNIHVSRTDPDAKLSTKHGRPIALNYLAQISVDVSSHIICGALGLYANIKDCRCMPYILGQTIENLSRNDIEIKEVLADTNYSSGEALKYLEDNGIIGYIPCTSNYKPNREGFLYDAENDYYLCKMNKKITFRYIHKAGNSQKEARIYRSSVEDCKGCPLRSQCIKSKKQNAKELSTTVDRPYYDRSYQRVHSSIGRIKKKMRSSTVEPVLGTLLDYRAMRRVRTRGIKLANKHVVLAAMAYNLKKLMKHKYYKSVGKVAIVTHNHLQNHSICLAREKLCMSFQYIVSVVHKNHNLDIYTH